MSEELDMRDVRALFEVRKEIKALQDEEKALTASIRERVQNGKTVSGKYLVTKSDNVRFNEELARQTLDKKTLKSLMVETVSTERAKLTLTPQEYEACQKSVGSILRVTLL